jgi:hypothetical protein
VDGQRILARLDRFYIFNDQPSGDSRTVVSYSIRGNSTFSDHLSVDLSIKLGAAHRKKGAWKMYIRYLEETKEEFKRIWLALDSNRFFFFAKIRRVIKFYKEYYIKKASEFKAKEAQLRQELVGAQTALQTNPLSGRLQLKVAVLKEKLSGFEKRKAEGIKIRSRLR